jgi:hypothetical protein
VIIVGSNVVRVGSLLVLRLMTLVAIAIHKLVVAVRMTRLTLRGNMSTSQRKSRGSVVECRVAPVRRRMTLSTVVIKVPRNVVGI